MPAAQELHLTVVEDRECQELLNRNGSLVRINVSLELCAGHKNYLPRFPVFTRVLNGSRVSGGTWTNFTELSGSS